MISSIKSAKRGFTLIEVLVAATLSLMLLGMMFAFLIPTMRASARGAARVEMQQQAVVALGKMADDLERSAPAGVSMNNNAVWSGSNQSPPVILGVQRLVDVGPTGSQVWDTSLYVYIWDKFDGTLSRLQEQSAMSAQAPARVTDGQLIGYDIPDTNNTVPRETLATGVVEFIVENPNGIGNIVSMPLTLRLVLGRNAATGARVIGNPTATPSMNPTNGQFVFTQYEETFDFQRTVAMRNSN